MKNEKKFPIAYATVSADVFISDGYTPKSFSECEEYFSKSLDALIRKIQKYIKDNKSFPRLLLLQDHVAVNIHFTYLYDFEKEFQNKLNEAGLRGMKVWLCFSGSDKTAILEKVGKYYPEYEFRELKSKREVEYMCPDDERYSYLIYKLEVDEAAEEEYVLRQEKELEERLTAPQSPKWDYYYDIIQQAPNKGIPDCAYHVEFPRLNDGQICEIILESGVISKAKIVGDCTFSEDGLQWQLTEGMKSGPTTFPLETKLGAWCYPRVIAWKRIQ